ncbi:MAG TPA: ATP-binding protein, partial [Geobacteraceae bacterium]|nr:ATP-binding protein [Geobacteraceae bacterium]
YFDKIFKEIDRIDGIMRKLLDASKRQKYELTAVSIDLLLDATLEVFKPQTELHNITVERDYRRIPPPIQADPSEIEQIFTNLFLNAIHEMPDNGKLAVELDHDGHTIAIRVSDSGKGIPRENLSNIFDPFFSTKSSGSGMGLALVRRIVNTYQGKIEVEKSDNTGTTFCVKLPLPSG